MDRAKVAENDQLEQESTKNQVLYPKIYAKVVEIDRDFFKALSGSGQIFHLNIRAKSGKGSTKDLQIGTKVKIFKRQLDKDYHYRFIGA